MKADYLTFRRGTTVSILGLVIQLVIALALLIYSQYGHDQLAFTAAVYVAIGIAVWGTLAALFDLHRRERLEAMEIESISGESTSAFSAGEEELRVAARRVVFMQRFFIPAVSLLIAAGLIAAGWWRFQSGRAILLQQDVIDPPLPGWAIAIGIGTAFVGFVFARFVAGMAKQRVWSSLRAGASWAVGAALFGFLMALAHFINYAAREDVVLRYMPVIFPIAMMLLGGEIVLGFALNLYRPRRPGEEYRPTFDSKVLGFLAAPDKIAESIGEALNYQFGVDVTGSWFYQLLSRWIAALVALAAVTAWLLTGLVVVEPHQQAMVLKWGQPTRELLGPGVHVKWPWPISTVVVPDYDVPASGDEPAHRIETAAGVRVLQIGTSPPDKGDGPILWSKQHATNEEFLIVQPPLSENAKDRSEKAPDVALVAVEVPLQYAITDVKLYDEFAAPDVRTDLLRSVGRRVAMQYLSGLSIDDILALKRSDLAAELQKRIQVAFDGLNGGKGAGIEILFVGAEGVHPPQRVADKFELVVKQKQVREQAIEASHQYQIETLTKVAGSVSSAERVAALLDQLDQLNQAQASESEIAKLRLDIQHELERAGGEVGASLIAASAERWTRHMDERGRAALHAGQVASYRAAPNIYRARKYFDALAQAMKDARVYIVPDDNGMVRFDLQDKGVGANIFDPNAGAPQ